MAYGEKYHVIYCDRNKRQFRLSIYERGFEGTSVRHKAARVPFSKTEETSSELKVGGIFPSRATITLVSSKVFNMEELYTADERKYMVSHEPTDGSDEGKWYGHIIPNGFTEEMDNDVHYMVLTASDNLPTLQLKRFEEAPGLNYGAVGSVIEGDFFQSFLWVAKEALKKTDFLLPIWTMVDIQPLLPSSGGVFAQNITVESTSTFIFHNYPGNFFIDPALLVPGNTLVISGSDHEQNNAAFVIDTADNYSSTGWRITLTNPGLYYDEFNYMDAITMELLTPSDPSTLPDPLAITVHDLRTYVRDQDIEGKNYYEFAGGAMMTWDVLNNLAKQWNAKIYQNNGRWEIVRWNAHMVPAGTYDYFVYNAEGIQTGRSPFGETIDYPCKSTRYKFRPFGHSISMDRVLGAVGVNYIYKFKTDGDSLINLIQNGSFGYIPIPGAPPPNANPSVFTPQRWVRRVTYGNSTNMMWIQQVLTPNPGEKFAPGIGSFIRFVGPYHSNHILSSNTGYPAPVNAGDELRIKWWQRVTWWNFGGGVAYRYVVLRIIVHNGSEAYCLVNAGPTSYISNSPSEPTGPDKALARWHKVDDNVWPCFISNKYGVQSPEPLAPWAQMEIDTPPCPIDGRISIEIVGAGAATALPDEPVRSSAKFMAYYPSETVSQLREWHFSNSEIHLTGFFVAKIVDPSNEKVQQIHPYWYENDGAYTDSIDDIEVLTGDDDNPDHVSNIYVLYNGQRRHVSQWDTWANDFGWGALGLILAKSVMQQYYRPWRIIDGEFAAEKWHWANRITFEERPGEVYALLRGTISPINNLFNGTVVQVYDANTPALPPGGNDGGNTVDPIWQQTGTTRCSRDENGENTGRMEALEVDMNPASQTYQQTRWIDIGENTGLCPIGEPIDLYWGASPLPITIDELNYYPVVKNGDEYTVQFDNDGTGKYLVFLWRKTLGSVQSILDVELEETISSWQVEPDMVINGYTYGVMRMQYMTGVFSGLDKTFKIN